MHSVISYLYNRWCNQPLSVQPLDCYSRSVSAIDKILVMDGYRLQRDNTS